MSGRSKPGKTPKSSFWRSRLQMRRRQKSLLWLRRCRRDHARCPRPSPLDTCGPWRCSAAISAPIARSCGCSFVAESSSARLRFANRGAPDHHRSSTKSRLLLMVRCTCFARIDAECVGSRSELGEAVVAAESSLSVYNVCSLIMAPGRGSPPGPVTLFGNPPHLFIFSFSVFVVS